MQATNEAVSKDPLTAERIEAMEALQYKSSHLSVLLARHRREPSAATLQMLGLAEPGSLAFSVIMAAKLRKAADGR